MMIKKNLVLILLLISVFALSVHADIAPPKGYTKVSINLVIETKEDLSDYRFFVDFYGDLNEIQVKNNGKTSIPPIGGGARYSSGVIYAIPRKNIESIGTAPTDEQLTGMSNSLKDNKIEGAVKLSEHSFYETVSVKNKKKVITPTYFIERKDNILIMSVKKAIKKVSFEEDAPVQDKSNTMIGGIFLSLFILFGGVFLFRKKS